jgi:RNA polymerase sigma factor (sigma-70 family)
METTGAAERHRWILQAVELYETRMLRFAARLLGDDDAARDAVQHAFLRLCGQSPEPLKDRVGQWLFAVCRHQVIDVLRKRKTVSTGGNVEPIECYDRQPDPAAAAEQADLYRVINRLVDQLPVPQREALSLWSEGFNYHQIAEMTDTTDGNVRVIVHRALKQLRGHPVAQRLACARACDWSADCEGV